MDCVPHQQSEPRSCAVPDQYRGSKLILTANTVTGVRSQRPSPTRGTAKTADDLKSSAMPIPIAAGSHWHERTARRRTRQTSTERRPPQLTPRETQAYRETG
jgi:hypothetical protein